MQAPAGPQSEDPQTFDRPPPLEGPSIGSEGLRGQLANVGATFIALGGAVVTGLTLRAERACIEPVLGALAVMQQQYYQQQRYDFL